MGSFYTNITLRGPDQDQVAEALAQQGRQAYVSPSVDGFTTVYEEQCETQDDDIIRSLASSLSAEFKCPALAVLNHDDDVLMYWLYEDGQLVDEYDSNPGYFEGRASKPTGGNATKLCELMESQDVETVASILKSRSGIKGYLFAVGRHEDLVNALGLPTFSIAAGYEYIERGELPPDLNGDSLKHTG